MRILDRVEGRLADPANRAQLVARVASHFMSLRPEEYGRGIQWTLRILGEFSGVDRSYSFELSEDGTTLSNTHEWCARGIEPARESLQDLPVEVFPWFRERMLRHGEVMHVPDVAALPPEAAAERREFEREGIQSLICVPLESAGRVIGFLGFDSVRRSRNWSEREVDLLRSVGGIVVGAINHGRAARLLRESRTQLVRAQDAGDVGLWTWEVKTNRVTLSDHACSIYGLDSETFGGRFEDVLPVVHPDDLERVLATQREALATRRGIPLEFRVRRGDDDVRLVRADAEMTLDDDGRPLRMSGMIQDITEKRAAEESHRRLSTAITQVADAVLVMDPECVIQYVNPAFEHITGYTRSEATGRPCHFLEDPDEGSALYDEVRAAVRAGVVWSGRVPIRPRGGGLVLMDTTVSPVHDAQGRIVNHVAVQRDVTREVEIEEHLRQVQKMEAVGMLAGGIAHDFNNLLIAIIGHSDLLIRGADAQSDVRRHATEIRKAGDRAKALTTQLLAFSRKQVLRPRVLDLNSVLDDLSTLLQRVIGEDIVLDVIRSAEPATVLADPGQMEQVVINLATNARDAMPRGGTLQLAVSVARLDEASARHGPGREGLSDGPHATLTVQDDGCGMDEETQARIFEPFFTTKEMGKGTGLGLATVYGIIRQSGGTVQVRSAPDAGATFEILLPVVDAPTDDRHAATASREAADGDEVVLVVEDEPSVASIVRSTLRSHGYTVLYAENGRHALEVASAYKGPLDLLFTDVVMPEMGGVALADALTQRYENLGVLYCSGYTDSALVQRGALIDGVAFLAKPFSPSTLVQKVRETLDLRSASCRVEASLPVREGP